MIGWFADRRQARLEADAERRLCRLLDNLAELGLLDGDFYLHAECASALPPLRLNTVLAGYGLPPARPEGRT